MKIQRFTIYCALLLCLVMASFASADEKKDSNNVCSNPDPASLCTADNTCGSASTPCMVNIKRTAYSLLRYSQHSRREGERSVLR